MLDKELAVRSLLDRLGRLVALRPGVVVLVAVVVTLLMGGLAGQQRDLENSSEAFSPDSPQLAAFEEIQDRFSSAETLTLQVLVVSDDGPVLGADGVRSAVAAAEVIRAELGDVLVTPNPALPPPVVGFAGPVIQAAQEQGIALADLDDAQARQLYEAALAEQPAQARTQVRQLLGGDPATATAGMILVTLDAAPYDGDVSAIVDDQFALVDALQAAEGPDDLLVFSSALLNGDDGSFQSEVGRLFGTAMAVILLVLGGVLRVRRGARLGAVGAARHTVADVLLTIGTVVMAIVWVQGAGVALGPDGLGMLGPPAPPSQIVPILLLALGVDYAIHLHHRYRVELAAGGRPGPAADVAVRTVGVALLLGALTTAIGFLTNLTSPIPAIKDLGVLSAVGLVAAFLLTTTFLPSVRILLDRLALRRGRLADEVVAPTEASLLPRIARAMGGPALRRPVLVLGVAGLVTAGAATMATQLETEFDLSAFLPDGTDIAVAYDTLQDSFGGGLGETTQVLLTGDALFTADAHNAQVAAVADLADADGVLSRGATAAGDAVPIALQGILGQVAGGTASPELSDAVAQARAMGLADDATVAEGADVRGIYTTLAAASPVLDAVVDLESDVPAARISLRTQSDRVGVEALRPAFEAALDPVAAAGVDVVVTSEAIIGQDSIAALQSSQLNGLAFALLAVLVILTVVYGLRLGTWLLGAVLLLPVGAVAVWTLGLMALTGIPFDPVTATISALVIGVGIDFTIHLGERFVEDLERAATPIAALRESLEHTGASLAGSALTTVLGFAVLTTSSLLPFQRLGTVTVYAVALSLFASLLVQPAVLLLWARRGGGERVAAHDTDVVVARPELAATRS